MKTTFYRSSSLLLAARLVAALSAGACLRNDADGAGADADGTARGCPADGTGTRVLRRLSRSEYDATIRDLFGFDSTYGAKFAADAVVDGFDNTASELAVSPLLADELREASEDIATRFMSNPGAGLPCSAQRGDASCASTFIDTFGKRAFRRPLTEAEAGRYKKLYSTYAPRGFATALELVISAMLQSPNFVYRTELGGVARAEDKSIKLTPYEIASELSYFIWGTMPDDALLAAADSGALATPAELEKQAKRLLEDPKSDATIMRFFEQWLDLNQLSIIPKDAATYPGFDDATREALLEETRRFIGYVVRQGTGTLPELLTATYSFVTPELAKFYGLPPPAGDGYTKVDVSGQGRAGLLTMGSVIATHSKPNQSSPIHRGKLVRERLLCQPLSPPPPNVNTTPPVIDPAKSTRERYEAHETQAICASCHNLMDPIGFSFEHFDGIGRYRPVENGKRIDATGEISSTPHTDTRFDGASALATILEKSADVASCFTKEWIRYGYGLSDGEVVSCVNDEVSADLQARGMKILDLILALTKTSYFTQRRSDPSAIDGHGTSASTSASRARGALTR